MDIFFFLSNMILEVGDTGLTDKILALSQSWNSQHSEGSASSPSPQLHLPPSAPPSEPYQTPYVPPLQADSQALPSASVSRRPTPCTSRQKHMNLRLHTQNQ